MYKFYKRENSILVAVVVTRFCLHDCSSTCYRTNRFYEASPDSGLLVQLQLTPKKTESQDELMALGEQGSHEGNCLMIGK